MQDDAARAVRLRKAQEEFQLEDEHAGGQQANSLLELQRAAKGNDKKAPPEMDGLKEDAVPVGAAEQQPGQEASASQAGSECVLGSA
jgi:hypothetical protein